MLTTITGTEMRAYEATAIRQFGISADELMQRAAAAVADAVDARLRSKDGVLFAYCGTGNNGGDGLAAIRILLGRHARLSAVVVMLTGKLSPDCEREIKRLEDAAGERFRFAEELPVPEDHCLAVIDALFGTGLSRPLVGRAGQAVAAINQSRLLNIPVISVDIPSGIHSDTGEMLGTAVYADETVTFHRPKLGLYFRDGIDHAGKITVADIGLNLGELSSFSPSGYAVMERQDLPSFLPPRRRNLHKGNCGRLLLLVGSEGMAGAAAISATAALRTGAGLVTVACPEKIVPIVQVLCPCATCLPLPEAEEEAEGLLRKAVSRMDAVGAGCGLGQSGFAKAMLRAVIEETAAACVPLLLDADALNLLPSLEKLSHPCWMITPHPGEAARLLGVTLPEVTRQMTVSAEKLQNRYAAGVVLKGAYSVIATKDGRALNPFGCAAMAKGGSGDALTGIATALLAGRHAGLYALGDTELLACACALHGLAGEEAMKHYGDRGVLATDLCAFLGLPFGNEEEDSSGIMRS